MSERAHIKSRDALNVELDTKNSNSNFHNRFENFQILKRRSVEGTHSLLCLSSLLVLVDHFYVDLRDLWYVDSWHCGWCQEIWELYEEIKKNIQIQILNRYDLDIVADIKSWELSKGALASFSTS